MRDPLYNAVVHWAFFDELEKEATWKDVKEVGESAVDAVKDTTENVVKAGRNFYEKTGIPEGRIGKTMKALARMLGIKQKEAERKEFNRGHFKQLLKNILVVGAGAGLGTAAGHTANHLLVKGTRRLSTPWKMRVTRHLPRAAAAAGGIGGILLAARKMKAQQLVEEKGDEYRRLEQGKNRIGGAAK